MGASSHKTIAMENTCSADDLKVLLQKVLALINPSDIDALKVQAGMVDPLPLARKITALLSVDKGIRIDISKREPETTITTLQAVSAGVTGEQYIERLEQKGLTLSSGIKEMLLCPNFGTTDGQIHTMTNIMDGTMGSQEKVREKYVRLGELQTELSLTEIPGETLFMMLDGLERNMIPKQFFHAYAYCVPIYIPSTKTTVNCIRVHCDDNRIFVKEYNREEMRVQYGDRCATFIHGTTTK